MRMAVPALTRGWKIDYLKATLLRVKGLPETNFNTPSGNVS
ncbi:hypothetical protein N8611_00620 [bacterium]|nr:hypothetical protein [Verrucomicrobiota bacterium]MDA7667487.1 hypothetical protein [bacterium]